MPEELRTKVLIELAKNTGKQVPAAFIKRTSEFIPEIERFHNLITGIYKPVWSKYALSIVVKIDSPYAKKDEIIFLEDGRWLMTYSPRAGGIHISDNQALVNCMHERIPFGVFQQVTKKTHQKGSTYFVLGLGLATSYDTNAGVFVIESADQQALDDVTNLLVREEDRYEIQLYAQLTNDFRPFIVSENVTYNVSTQKRESAFRHIILQEYDFTCAVCEMKFRLGDLAEATAAHIIPKYKNGTDDPRNGLALCHTHHWAFDEGIFTLNDQYEILLSPQVKQSETKNFQLTDLNGKMILLPQNPSLSPHLKVIDWHRAHVWKK